MQSEISIDVGGFLCSPNDSFTAFGGPFRSPRAGVSGSQRRTGRRGRTELLADLRKAIVDDEAATLSLLRGFDIGEDVDSTNNSSAFEDFLQLTDSLEYPSVENQTSLDFSLPDPRTKRPPPLDISNASLAVERDASFTHPFLATPLRLQHFPKLSPTTLSSLLRSPEMKPADLENVEDESFDPPPDSFGSSNKESSIVADTSGNSKELGILEGYFSQPARAPPAIIVKSALMTPPPTLKLPATELPLDIGVLGVGLEVETPSPGKTLATSQDTFLSPLPSPPIEEESEDLISGSYFSHRYPAVLPATVNQFRRVIGEMTGKKPLKHRRSSPEVSVVTASPTSLSAACSPIHLTERKFSKRRAGFLEVEFAQLLRDRAADEEAEAEVLYDMAQRLKSLAKKRRALAERVQS
ncbi:hypothetical protein CYLTODRAFT_454526 [Cylindrobasidium torrendii FP15055 ss-10]|uniref:Uncharacterized protein n=1 Tax=Cylindrobasidium torrendii FP15055 ss-10 TaxID=1314674 RepID=A0A0D7BAY9_9AGAR|nr:hypothetical protein CYLTODRAFT_454526 [Cylindrobasidium torrendii FP15055 ss-10]